MLNETSLTLRRRRVMMNKMIAVRRWSVLILCFAMVITCIPMLEGAVYAADDKTEVKVVELSEEEQQKGMEQIDRLNQRFSDLVVKTVEKNIDN